MAFQITVGPKPSNHPFYGKGSQYCYYINNIPGQKLELVPGTEYIFMINTPGHPFYFTQSESGGSEDSNILAFQPIDQGIVHFTMLGSYPQSFYYQCKIHSYMGGPIIKSHNTFYVKPLLNGLVAPTALTSPDTEHIYIADQIGVVYKFHLITQEISVFLDIRKNIVQLNPNYDERGLLGLCFHPDYSHNGRFFIYYSTNYDTNKDYYNCVSEFTVQNGRVIYEAELVLIRMLKSVNYHNGGKIGFGPDGYLYIAVGDNGGQGKEGTNGQNLTNLFGKILRIDVNNRTDKYYSIPSDNPFVNVPNTRPEIWAYGFRNPWGLDFIGNKLIVTDAGYESGIGQEEVNIVIKGGNYGWNIKEGSKLTLWTSPSTNTVGMIDPIFAYTTSDPQFADSNVSVIIGGYMDKSGDYICADYSGRLIRLRFKQNGVQVIEMASLKKYILSFGKSNDQLYVLTSERSGPRDNTGEIIMLMVV